MPETPRKNSNYKWVPAIAAALLLSNAGWAAAGIRIQQYRTMVAQNDAMEERFSQIIEAHAAGQCAAGRTLAGQHMIDSNIRPIDENSGHQETMDAFKNILDAWEKAAEVCEGNS